MLRPGGPVAHDLLSHEVPGAELHSSGRTEPAQMQSSRLLSAKHTGGLGLRHWRPMARKPSPSEECPNTQQPRTVSSRPPGELGLLCDNPAGGSTSRHRSPRSADRRMCMQHRPIVKRTDLPPCPQSGSLPHYLQCRSYMLSQTYSSIRSTRTGRACRDCSAKPTYLQTVISVSALHSMMQCRAAQIKHS